VNPPNPTRQVALVGETRRSRDFGQARSSITHKLDRTLQSLMHHVTMRRHADRASEHACEVELAAPDDAGERGYLNRLVQMGHDVVFEPLEHVLAQCPSRPALKIRSVSPKQTVNEGARHLVPGERPIRVGVRALRRQAPRKIEQDLIVPRKPLDQPRVNRRILGGGEREPGSIATRMETRLRSASAA